jgi:hypothetical protein
MYTDTDREEMENKAIGGRHGLYRDGSVAGLILEGFLGAKRVVYITNIGESIQQKL